MAQVNIPLLPKQHNQLGKSRHSFYSHVYNSQSTCHLTRTYYPLNHKQTTQSANNSTMKLADINIKAIGIGFFAVACLFCVYGILTFKDDVTPRSKYTTELKLVNIFVRHADRGPSDELPKGDLHQEVAKSFWPNGLSNLTDAGKQRAYKIGTETRRYYSKFLDYDSSQILVYSSPITRCIESSELILKGLFNIETTREKGRHILNKSCSSLRFKNSTKSTATAESCLYSGSGFPDEWKKILIDTSSLRALTYHFLNDCKYRKENPSPVDADLTASQAIKNLKGIETLRKTIADHYDMKLDFSSLGLWSTITAEMNMIRTHDTIKYAKHYLDWINKPIEPKSDIGLYDLHEQTAVMGYRDRVVGDALYVQIGPIITSLIESQAAALATSNNKNSTYPKEYISNQLDEQRMQNYKGKKMIFYTTHDSILQLIMNYLDVMHIDSSFESRYNKWKKSDDEVGKFMAGLKMSEYGFSARFELIEQTIESTGEKFPFVQVSLYNKADGKNHNIDYKVIPFGSICQRKFLKTYPGATSELNKFFPGNFFHVNHDISCPYALLKNITSDMMLDNGSKLKKLCDY